MVKNNFERSDLVKLVKKICIADFESEEEYEEALKLFEKNVADPDAYGLIYQKNPELTPEEIVDKALSYQPIIMPPPSKD